MKDALFYMGVPRIITYGRSVQAMNWESVKPKKKNKIERDISKIAKELKKADIPRVGIKTKMFFTMMRNMKKAGMG